MMLYTGLYIAALLLLSITVPESSSYPAMSSPVNCFHLVKHQGNGHGRSFLRSVAYYSNSTANFHLLRVINLSNDIEVNPGPVKNPCGVCSKPLRSNQRTLTCCNCEIRQHAKCVDVNKTQFLALSNSNDWCCSCCSLPQFTDSFFDASLSTSTSSSVSCVSQLDDSSNSSSVSLELDGSNLKCLYLNIRSCRNKTVNFQALIYSLDYDIILLTESWLNSTIPNSFVLPAGYTIFRSDRVKGRGGGVLIAIKQGLPSRRLMNCEIYPESCVVEISPNPGKDIILTVVYRPPDADLDDMMTLNSLFHTVHKNNSIIVGDFNIKNINWSSNQYKSQCKPIEREFCDIVNNHYLKQFVNFPTRISRNGTRSILDLILAWAPDIVHNVREGSDSLGSDHFSVCFSIPISKKFVKQPKRAIFNFKRADWNGLKYALASDSWYLDTSNIDSMWNSWFQNFTKIVDNFIPKISCRCRNSAPWIDSDIINLVKKKERAWIKF